MSEKKDEAGEIIVGKKDTDSMRSILMLKPTPSPRRKKMKIIPPIPVYAQAQNVVSKSGSALLAIGLDPPQLRD